MAGLLDYILKGEVPQPRDPMQFLVQQQPGVQDSGFEEIDEEAKLAMAFVKAMENRAASGTRGIPSGGKDFTAFGMQAGAQPPPFAQLLPVRDPFVQQPPWSPPAVNNFGLGGPYMKR